MGRTFQPADGICHSIWGGAGSWGFGTVWHKPDDTAVAAIAVLGGDPVSPPMALAAMPRFWPSRSTRTKQWPGTPQQSRLALWQSLYFCIIFNGLFSIQMPKTLLGILTLFAQTSLIVATVNGVLAFYSNNKKPSQRIETVHVLQRLPIEKRGELISMTVMDHYVEVTKTRGKHLILMRFNDAITEIPPHLGLQIHRSYWVASDQVQAHRRDGKQLLLITTAQDALPVSRRYRKAVFMAGLLPM